MDILKQYLIPDICNIVNEYVMIPKINIYINNISVHHLIINYGQLVKNIHGYILYSSIQDYIIDDVIKMIYEYSPVSENMILNKNTLQQLSNDQIIKTSFIDHYYYFVHEISKIMDNTNKNTDMSIYNLKWQIDTFSKINPKFKF